MGFDLFRAEEGAEKVALSKWRKQVDSLGGPTNDPYDFFDRLLYRKLPSKMLLWGKYEFFITL